MEIIKSYWPSGSYFSHNTSAPSWEEMANGKENIIRQEWLNKSRKRGRDGEEIKGRTMKIFPEIITKGEGVTIS